MNVVLTGAGFIIRSGLAGGGWIFVWRRGQTGGGRHFRGRGSRVVVRRRRCLLFLGGPSGIGPFSGREHVGHVIDQHLPILEARRLRFIERGLQIGQLLFERGMVALQLRHVVLELGDIGLHAIDRLFRRFRIGLDIIQFIRRLEQFFARRLGILLRAGVLRLQPAAGARPRMKMRRKAGILTGINC